MCSLLQNQYAVSLCDSTACFGCRWESSSVIIQNKVHFLDCLFLSNMLKTLQGERWYRTFQTTISLLETASILFCSWLYLEEQLDFKELQGWELNTCRSAIFLYQSGRKMNVEHMHSLTGHIWKSIYSPNLSLQVAASWCQAIYNNRETTWQFLSRTAF